MKKSFTIILVLIFATTGFAGTSVGKIYEVIGAYATNETSMTRPIYVYDGVSEYITFKATVSKQTYEGKSWRLYFRTRLDNGDTYPHPVGDITVTRINENSYRLVASMPASYLHDKFINNDVCFCAGTYGTSHNYNTPVVYIRKSELVTITWNNYDNTPITSSQIPIGVVPTYSAETPERSADAQYTYTFSGWTPEIVKATGNATYTAQFTSTLNKYAVTFANYDGTPLQSGELEYGTTPTYTGATPTKPADAQYTYTFAGWDAELSTVTGAVTYTAQFTSTLNKYAVTFANYDGTLLQSGELEYGTTPTYTGETPTKPADEDNTYTFSGWTPAVVAVAGNASYTATFLSVPFVKYTVTWQDEDGNILKTDEVAQGTTPAFTGTTPTKEGYTFAGWLPNIKPATEDTKYTTYFIPTQQQESKVYTVNINGENCSLNINNQYPEGTVITLEAVADECFEFQQWSDGNKDNPRTVTVTANTNLTAEFNKVRYTATGQPSTGGKVQIRKQ